MFATGYHPEADPKLKHIQTPNELSTGTVTSFAYAPDEF